jgi:carbon monoxide dehydrogenase subunit G
MLVTFNQTLTVAATKQEAWNLLRDASRLADLIPSIESIAPVVTDGGGDPPGGLPEKYLAHVVERVGPFRLSLNLDIRIVKAVESSLLQAELTGTDRNGQNRMSGTLRADLKENTPGGTVLNMDSSMEVTGALATLGAAPIRRRANELFAQFTERLQSQFSLGEKVIGNTHKKAQETQEI